MFEHNNPKVIANTKLMRAMRKKYGPDDWKRNLTEKEVAYLIARREVLRKKREKL